MVVDDSSGESARSVEEVFLEVMTSRWSVSSLQWCNGWVWFHDRPLGVLDDETVLEKFGDEAFRRRDSAYLGAWTFEPRVSQLIGRRVVAQLQNSGWQVEDDDSRHLVTRQDSVILTINGEHNGSLLLRDGHSELMTNSVAVAERWLLRNGVGESRMSELSEIVSVR